MCWKGPLEVTWFNSLLLQGHSDQVAQDHVQTVYEYLQGGRLHNFSVQLVLLLPMLSSPSEFIRDGTKEILLSLIEFTYYK